jgi:hypothetical protein
MLSTDRRGVMRIADGAILVPTQQHAVWIEQASAMPGFSRFELSLLGAIAEHHRRACACHAARLSIESLALDAGASPRRVRRRQRSVVCPVKLFSSARLSKTLPM